MELPKICTNKSDSCDAILALPQPKDVFSGFIIIFVLRGKLAGYKKNGFDRGSTLLEVIIVVCLLAMVGAAGLPIGIGFYGDSFRSDRDMAVASLQKARSLAINNICLGSGCVDGKSHGVHFDPEAREVVIFQGEDFSGRDKSIDEVIEFGGRTINIEDSSAFDIVFERLSGNSSVRSIIMNNGRGRFSTISINGLGRIDWQ